MIVKGIQCPECGERIWSRSHHDFRYCTCGKCFVDGGRSYLRYGSWIEDLDRPPEVEINTDVSCDKGHFWVGDGTEGIDHCGRCGLKASRAKKAKRQPPPR